MTLIKSNPRFKNERVAYFHTHYNSCHKSEEEINTALRKTDLLCNAINEKTGGSISSETMYLMAIADINNNNTPLLMAVDLPQLYDDMEELMLDHYPLPYCSQTERTLAALRKLPNVTIGLLSNTGYTKGHTLRKILEHNGLGQYFDFQLYSDEENLSKPNIQLFNTMIERAQNHLPNRQLDRQQIIHIGDNAHADIAGAYKAGINSLLVNSNNTCIASIHHK
jgi:putative hydrolase of the HAD superfamily